VFYVAGNLFTARWGHRYAPRRLILASSIGCMLAAAAGAIALPIAGMSAISLFVPTSALYFFAALGIAPVQAEAVAAQPGRAGAASGLLTASQMVIGALTVQVIGFSHDGTARPLFVGLVACSVLAVAGVISFRRRPEDAGMTASTDAAA
jgi:DHA1 family bicyclomycin/chloramphenicol resistance-like MFS transporter